MKLIHFLVFFLFGLVLLGQEKSSRSISILSKSGFLMAHRAEMSHLVQGLNYGFELEFSKQRDGKEISSQLLRFPVQGFSLIYQDFGYRSVLGQGFGVTQFTKFRLFEHTKIGFFDFKLASGLALITKDYDPETNNKNNAIGSHLNHLVSMQVGWERHFNHINLGVGIEISHYSNAALNAPNLGLNTPLLHLKLGYNTSPRRYFEKAEIKSLPIEKNSTNGFQFGLMATVKQNLPGAMENGFLPVIGLQFAYRKKMNLKWDLEGTMDVIYNQANRIFYDNKTYTFSETVQLGFMAGAAINFYKAQVYFGLGAYVYNKIDPAGYVYNRLGYRRKLGEKERWRIFIGIKANLGKADYMETGVVYAL